MAFSGVADFSSDPSLDIGKAGTSGFSGLSIFEESNFKTAGNVNLARVSIAPTRIASASICSAFIFLAVARLAIVPTNDLEALILSSFFLPKNDLTNEKPNFGNAVTAWKPALSFLNGAVIEDFKLAATILTYPSESSLKAFILAMKPPSPKIFPDSARVPSSSRLKSSAISAVN